MRFKKYNDKVYGINYCFVFDVVDVKKIQEFLDKKDKKIARWYKSIDVDNTIPFAGKTIKNTNNILVLIKKDKDASFVIATLVHELLHALFFVFGERGIEIQQGGGNEHATYYLDHLVYEALRK